jgi:phage repressor protein C with HTH and peptisase S24 domain
LSAQGGSLNDFIVSVKGSDCEKIVSPIKGADWAITVSGDSMAPEFPAGSLVLIKKINEKAFIDWGKVYVLDTCNGTVIKILEPSKKDGYIKCSSINPEPRYAPFEVSFDDIYGIYRVMLCMAVK